MKPTNLEICKKLKEIGYPQPDVYAELGQYYKPTLQELLDHLGERFQALFQKTNGYQASAWIDGELILGNTANTYWQALALLVIELESK
jgi:hypothetical protein